MAEAVAAGSASGNSNKLSAQEKLAKALEFKRQGNEFYKDYKYKAAISKYHRALLYLKGIEGAAQGGILTTFMQPIAPEAVCVLSEEDKDQTEKLKLACYNNLAACLLQTEDPSFDKVVSHCNEVLRMAPRNLKALYRKGKALLKLGDVDRAQDTLMKGSRLPDGAKDPLIKQLLQECSKRLAEEDRKLRQTYKGMCFDQLSLDETFTLDDTISPTKEDEDLPADDS